MKQSKPNKALNVFLVISLAWVGAGSSIPSVYAETNTSTVQENQLASNLSKLEIEGKELDQKFAADLFEYTATVGNEVENIKLLVDSSNTDASITINGQEIVKGTTGTYALQTGDNKFIISVNNGTGSSNTYTLTVTREKNANNFLKSIELSKGELSPKFSSDVNEYNVNVSNEIPAITFKPTAIEATSTIKVNSTITGKNGVDVSLPVGQSDIMITVTAENGKKKIYTIHVTRMKAVEDKAVEDTPAEVKAPAANQKNNPVSIQPSTRINTRPNSAQPTSQQQSSLNTETWDSNFTSDEFTYHITVSSDADEITLKPIAKYSRSEISIEGGTSKTIKLENDKKTIISVVVTYDDVDRKTYVLVFDKES
ncbi:cadherin-like beta sandwich domain-containing protein [Neobacillus sp. MER 74]|uniref:cadherin-like beta sandwich domain-containing protein n=1 Tax=Neobacillus sp. MER 74 TaxID=2939566 RepID=UPI00204073E0|nr:cadherin-like beta sandwich domain-containing protein [Neobacillus sp. MER 74]MCM3114192.1 cadherin-like beta sandwich domain-containing protein [Neobacillus sp. MER 74]